MSQAKINKEYHTFVKGLVTESGPFTYPENASTSESNFVLNTKGYRSKRLGVDTEDGETFYEFSDDWGSSASTGSLGYAISHFKWIDVGSSGDLDILVVQTGDRLTFFDMNPSSGTILENVLNGGDYVELAAANPDAPASFANIAGKLVVAYGTKHCSMFEYDADADQIIEYKFGLLVRDIWGIEDNTEVDERLNLLTEKLNYNLYNQGWGVINPDSGTSASYAASMKTDTGVYPSNADTPSSGINSADSNKFSGSFVERAMPGKSYAPRGSFVIDVFNRGESRNVNYNFSFGLGSYESILTNYGVQDWETLVDNVYTYGVHLDFIDDVTITYPIGLYTEDYTNRGVTVLEAHAGRMFYAGFDGELKDGDTKSPDLRNYIIYSQTMENSDKVGKCYQEGDPTSLNNFDLVDTDGGSIKIAGAGKIKKMVSSGEELLIFATNGVWALSGEESIGFKPTSFSLNRVTNIGVDSPESVVYVKGSVFYWSKEGIYLLSKDSTTLTYNAISVTNGTIKSFFTGLTAAQKSGVRGDYNQYENTVSWTYGGATSDLKQFHNKQLNFNLDLQAFYLFEIGDPDLLGIGEGVIPFIYGSVTDNAGVEHYITIHQNTTFGTSPPVRSSYQIGFSSLTNTDFTDWGSITYSGTAYEYAAYLETGFETLQNSDKEKQLKYIVVDMEMTEDGFTEDLELSNPSSCLMSAIWDFSSDSSNPKTTTPYEVYRLRRDYIAADENDNFTYPYSVITTKNKIRGRGKSLKLRFESPAGYNLVLYGWNATYLGNTEE